MLIEGSASGTGAIAAEPLRSLREVLARPDLLRGLTAGQWDAVLRQARAAGLAARLSYVIKQRGWREQVPAPVLRHLDAERRIADKLGRDVKRELGYVLEPLLLSGVPVIVLKGAAYLIADLPAAAGRVFTDIDIMVPRELLEVAEQRLIAAGWRGDEESAWDRRFYRRWGHQIPPVAHVTRGSVVDLHFAIVPQRGRGPVPSAPLFKAAIPAAGDPRTQVLAPCDMILHSAVHLFNGGEFDRGLRDLVDLDLLLRHFSPSADFWTLLVRRGNELGLGRPLYYTLRYTRRFLATPVPPAASQSVARFGPAVPGLMDALFERALRPPHPMCRDRLAKLAIFFLYLRGHWLRLPLYLLAPHLLRAAFVRGFGHRLTARGGAA